MACIKQDRALVRGVAWQVDQAETLELTTCDQYALEGPRVMEPGATQDSTRRWCVWNDLRTSWAVARASARRGCL